MRKTLPFIFIVVGLVVVYIVNKNIKQQTTTITPKPLPFQVESIPDTSKKIPEQTSITVVAKDYKFDPAEIKIKKGTPVKITLSVVGGFHDLRVDELNWNLPALTEGESSTLEFQADMVGIFEYYCSIGDHRERGMIGKLIVEE